MPKSSAAHEKKVNSAVRTLQTTTGLRVPQAMILAGFSKNDVANKNVRQMVRSCYQQTRINVVVINDDLPSLSDLTNDNVQSPTTTSTMATLTTTSESTTPTPKCKQIRLTAKGKQQQRVDNLRVRKHKSDALKAAVRLYNAEQQKPNGLSIRQVRDVIMERFGLSPSIATISRYNTQGLIDASPKKMGPIGRLTALTFKILCSAYSSMVPINQMNSLAGNNTRKKMIPVLAETFSIRTLNATELLNRVIRGTAIDINADKLNCVEDRRVRWTTAGNLKLWFNTWEKFVVEY